MLRQLTKFARTAIMEDFGIPVRVREALQKTPDLSFNLKKLPRVVAMDSIIRWDDWNTTYTSAFENGFVNHWAKRMGQYGCRHTHRREFEQLTSRVESPHWAGDIRDVEGLSTSKSHLEEFRSLDEMAEKQSADLIGDASRDRLDANLAHEKGRILNSPAAKLARFGWDDRIFLVNNGGSHHFAAARHIAGKMNIPVQIEMPLVLHQMNPSALNALRRDFDIYAVHNKALHEHVFKAMQDFTAPFLVCPLPRPLHGDVIMLEKADKRAQRVSALFKAFNIFDLGEHLQELCNHPANSQIYPPPSRRTREAEYTIAEDENGEAAVERMSA